MASSSAGDLNQKLVWAAAAVLCVVFVWAYWPTLDFLVGIWDQSADYSHGYLVVPFVAFVLWLRRDEAPRWDELQWSWLGVPLILFAIGMRFASSYYGIHTFERYSIIPWVFGAFFCCGGLKIMRWAWPALIFLVFMIPLPSAVEASFRGPLQRVATIGSTWTLQCFGFPALAEGNVIMLGEQRLEVAEACSGLRIFFAIVACAVGYVVLVRPKWWEALFVAAAIVPVALIANMTRIVVTGLLYQVVSEEAGKQFSHDIAGYLMIPLAALMFWGLMAYLGRLVEEGEVLDVRSVLMTDRT